MNLLLCLLVFFPSKTITVIDFKTNKPVPFVSFIGVKDSKGGYADENGKISFEGNMTQPFIVSCVGYLTDTVSFDVDTIQLKPQTIVLATVKVSAKKINPNSMSLGFFKKNTWESFVAQTKYEFYTYIANPDTSIKWQIESIKIAARGYRKKGKFESFKIRPFLKDVLKKLPNNSMLMTDITVDVPRGENSVTIKLDEPLTLPKEGCFVGFETIGYSIEPNQFIPYSDFVNDPDGEKVQINIPLTKSNSRSLWRVKNGKGWYGSPSDVRNAFAFGLEVSY